MISEGDCGNGLQFNYVIFPNGSTAYNSLGSTSYTSSQTWNSQGVIHSYPSATISLTSGTPYTVQITIYAYAHDGWYCSSAGNVDFYNAGQILLSSVNMTAM